MRTYLSVSLVQEEQYITTFCKGIGHGLSKLYTKKSGDEMTRQDFLLFLQILYTD